MSTARAGWTRVAIWLVATTMAYNAVEAVLAVWAGVVARSIALVGFGLDSVIEVAAAGVLFYRLAVEARGASTERVERTERRVLRFVGFTFFALAAYVVVVSVSVLLGAREPEESTLGIVLAAVSLVVMPVVAAFKLRAAREIGSSALRAEAKETLACAWLSFALLLGLVLNAAVGWWQADPIAALVMVPWLLKEGREAWTGECTCH